MIDWSLGALLRTAASDWIPIAGATADTYTPATGDMGYYLRATASYDR